METDNNIMENDQISIADLIKKVNNWYGFLKTKWNIILITTLLGAIIGLSISYLVKPTYKAVLTFAMEEDKGGSGGGIGSALGLASSFGIDLGGVSGGGAFSLSNLAELMKSRLIIEKVLLKPINIKNEKTTLADYYIKINDLKKKWPNTLKNLNFLPNIDRSRFSLQQDSVIQKIYKDLIDKESLIIMQKDKKVTILTIEVNNKNELFAKVFCENLAKETSDFYIETKIKKARINVNVLQKQVDSVRSELNGAISGVAAETDNVYNMNPALNIKSAPSKRKQIDVQANTAILTNLVIQLELAKITLRKETPLIQLIDKPIFPLEKDKYGKLNSLIIGGFFAFLISILFIFFNKLLQSIF